MNNSSKISSVLSLEESRFDESSFSSYIYPAQFLTISLHLLLWCQSRLHSIVRAVVGIVGCRLDIFPILPAQQQNYY